MARGWLTFLPGILRNVGIAWRLMQNPTVSPWVKFLLPLTALVYYFSPIDLLPGLPFDDLVVVFLIFPQLMMRLAPKEAVDEAMYGRPAQERQDGDEDDDNVIDVPWQTLS